MLPLKLELEKPHTVYKNAAGKRVPSVTTVLGALAKPHLLRWYANEERAGILRYMESAGLPMTAKDLEAWLPMSQGKPLPFAETKRDKAADLGTITHARIEAWLRQTTLDPGGIPPDLYQRSAFGLNRFTKWWAEQFFTGVECERKLVSEALQVGGTADIVTLNAVGAALVDIKTSKASKRWPYAENIAQVAAYAEMLEEADEAPIRQVWLVRVGKELDDTIEAVQLTDGQRTGGLALFGGALQCHLVMKQLAKE